MSGWLMAWGRDRATVEPERWERALTAAGRYGDVVSRAMVGRVSIAAWRRGTGEFPASGVLHTRGHATVAWVGQTVDDSGDASRGAIDRLATAAPGDKTVGEFNGAFAAAVARDDDPAVTLWTDRYRHYPIYMHESRDLVVASTEMRCVIPFLRQPRIAPASLDLFLRCGELIDQMTMVEGVTFVPPATAVHDRGEGPKTIRYWKLRHTGDGFASIRDATEAVSMHLPKAVQRIEAAAPRLGVTLSGGLDSRVILGLCRDPSHVPSFTWGEPGCRDIECAKAFAARVGSPHTVRHWEPGAFPPLWARGVDVTGGGFGVEGMYMLPFVGLLAERCDATLNGLAGDAILGGNFLKLSWLRLGDVTTLAEASWRWRVSPEQDQWANRLLNRPDDSSPGRERWIGSIGADAGRGPIERLNDWLYENRVFRNTNCGTMLLRRGVESHAPFFDRDVVDALLRVPLAFKLKHRLYLRVLRRVCPAAAAVKWQRTGLPPAWGLAPNVASMAAQSVVTRALRPMGLRPFKSLPVADPAAWFRGAWREPAAAIILGARALGRGLVSPDAVRELWESHQSGATHTRQLGALVAVEVFCRQLLDGEDPGEARP